MTDEARFIGEEITIEFDGDEVGEMVGDGGKGEAVSDAVGRGGEDGGKLSVEELVQAAISNNKTNNRTWQPALIKG